MSNRLSVFIPAFNEEGNIEATVHELRTALQAQAIDYEIIIVNDGSSDRTAEIAEALRAADSRIRVIHNPRNLGLAKTFRIGAQAARLDYVGWIPGDNGFPAASLEQWLAPIGKADLIQTHLLNSEVRYLGRRIISRGYTRTMNTIFGLRIKYYNGIQIYRREAIQSIETSSDGFALLSEILVKLLATGNSYIEVGINMQERAQGQSKAVKIKNILDVIKTVIRLFVDIKIVHRSRYRSRGVKLPWWPQQPAPKRAASAAGAMEAE
jgi:glycosyltransferase involved in cell wall biosynthesis